ncbi:hypothetical protein N0V88_003361 [Collariella sp. IMI 366227]|nr:hypothetical protein N0V88_003361 [Collariella sp. IMI 366227]
MATSENNTTRPNSEANPSLKSYYESLKSRIGYRLVLGGTRHYGFYKNASSSPFPIGRALRAVEDKMFQVLDLSKGSQVIDAGCGVGHAALYMARRGLRITALDIINHHVASAQKNVARSNLPPGQVNALVGMTAYWLTMSIFLDNALGDVLFHVQRVVVFEEDQPATRLENTVEAGEGGLWVGSHSRRCWRRLGFTVVKVEDFSENIRPMLRLFYVLAAVPYFFIKLFRLERFFINTVAGAQEYVHQKHWRYVAITATKPGPRIEEVKTK